MRTRQRVVCVAFALVCSILLASAAWGVYEQSFTQPQDFSKGTKDRVLFSEEAGGLSLCRTENCVPFIWVPNSVNNTVVKIDARTGSELARYKIGPANENWGPNATAVDLKGNTYIACYHDEGTGRIVEIPAASAFASQEDLHYGRIFEVGAEGSSPSCLAFDANGFLWVGLWGDHAVAKVDVRSGKVVATVPVNGRPNMMLADSRQNLWVLSRENKVLCQVNTLTHMVVDIYEFEDFLPGGMCLDGNGKLWIGDMSQGLRCLNIATRNWTVHKTETAVGCLGVAVDANGDIWAACPTRDEVAIFSGEDGTMINAVGVGMSPGSICIDSDDYIWAFNEGVGSAARINPRTDKAVLTTPKLSAENGIPIASCVIEKGISPIGSWSALLDSEIIGAAWGKVLWDAVLGSGKVKVFVRVAETQTELVNCDFQAVENGIDFASNNGRYMQIRAELSGDGNLSPILRGLRVEGVNQAPNILAAAPTVSLLTDPDHSMQSVGIAGVYDPEGDPFEVTITSVSQDEPIAGLCEEDKFPDAIGTGCPTVWLRGEYDEGTIENPGNGRVYTVCFKAVDKLGAVSTGKVKVTVPKGILPTDVAIDDGQKYDSAKEMRQLIAQIVD